MAKALIPLAKGFEDVEAVTVIDVLRRGGVEVVTASLSGATEVVSAHGITMKADARLADVADGDFDAIVLPGGGEGTENLKNSDALIRLLQRQNDAGRWLCAICAAPTVLVEAGVLAEGLVEELPVPGVEAVRALVQKKQGWPWNQRPAEQEDAQLPLREGQDAAIQQAGAAKGLRHFLDPGLLLPVFRRVEQGRAVEAGQQKLPAGDVPGLPLSTVCSPCHMSHEMSWSTSRRSRSPGRKTLALAMEQTMGAIRTPSSWSCRARRPRCL